MLGHSLQSQSQFNSIKAITISISVQQAPVFEAKIVDSSLQTIKIDPTGRLVALGAGDGTSVIGSFSDSLLDNNKFERQELNS